MTEKQRQASRDAQRRWRERHPDRYQAKYRADNNWRKYGLTEEQWLHLMSLGCGICGTMTDLVIDHDHKTNKVRGALCNTHNTTLGKFGEDPDMLRKAIRWLEK